MADQQPNAANAPMLHRFLGIGATILSAALVLLRANAGMPEQSDTMTLIAYGIAVVSIGLVVVSVMVLTPRVPERRAGESVDAFWKNPAVTSPVLQIWFMTEGAVILAAVGYYLTGLIAPAAAMVVALGVYWWLGPRMFAKPS